MRSYIESIDRIIIISFSSRACDVLYLLIPTSVAQNTQKHTHQFSVLSYLLLFIHIESHDNHMVIAERQITPRQEGNTVIQRTDDNFHTQKTHKENMNMNESE